MERRKINKNIDLNQDPQSSSSEDSGGSSEVYGIEKAFRKRAWTREEDELLISYIKKHGTKNWNNVEKYPGLSRSGKSCRLRWMDHLRPGLKKGPFTEEEEKLVTQLYKRFGPKWARMAAHIQGRTDNDIKNFWYGRATMLHRQGGQTSENTNSLNVHPTPETLDLLKNCK